MMPRTVSNLPWAMRSLILLLCPGVLALAQWLCGLGPHPIAEVDVQTAANTQDVLWIDARSREQFDAGHVPGAMLLNQQEWETLLPGVVEAWSPGRPVIVYCGSRRCEDAHLVAQRLAKDLDARSVRVLRGGFGAWRSSGKPVALTVGGTDAN